MAMAEDGSFKPIIRASRLALTSKAAMAGYIYACEYCEKRFQSMKYLKEHQHKCRADLIKDHGTADIFTCEFCLREFTCGAFAKSHMRYCDRSWNMQKSECCYCKKEFTSEHLPSHKDACLARKSNIVYTCCYCGYRCENSIDCEAHKEKCRALKALAYAPKQVLHKCKACGKLFQGKENFVRHTTLCPSAKIDRQKLLMHQLQTQRQIKHHIEKPADPAVSAAQPDSDNQPEQHAPPIQSPDKLPVSPVADTRGKRPHSIKKNQDGSMVIILAERDGSNKADDDIGEIVKKAKLADPEALGKSSIVIDLRGKKILPDNDENADGSKDSPRDLRQMLQPQQTSAKSPATNKPVMNCPYCKIPFVSKTLLNRHLQKCYLGKERYSVECQYCRAVFGDLHARTLHQRVCSSRPKGAGPPPVSPANSKNLWNEPLVVSEPAPLMIAEQSPEKSEHSDAATPKHTKPPESVARKTAVPIESPYVCDYCKVPYESRHLLNRHMKSCYLGKQRYSLQCSFCSLSFTELRSRTEHEKACGSKMKVKKASVVLDPVFGTPVCVQEEMVDAVQMDERMAVVPAAVSDFVSEDAGRDALADDQPQSRGQPDERASLPGDIEPEKETPRDPGKSAPKKVGYPRISLQKKHNCDICGMEGFQQETSLMSHKNFCSWVSQQKVKAMPEKKLGSDLSISARTSDALFNETIPEQQLNKEQSRKKDMQEKAEQEETTEVSLRSVEGSVDSCADDNVSDDDDDGATRLMFVDGTVDSDDEYDKQKVRHRRSSKKFDRMSVSPKSVSSVSSRGSSVDRARGKSGVLGKNNNEIGKGASKVEIECQCGEKFGNKEAHRVHLPNCGASKGSVDDTQINCRYCKKRMKSSSLASHLKICKKTCIKCKRQFGNFGALISHQRFCTAGGSSKTSNKKDKVSGKSEIESSSSKIKKVVETTESGKKTVSIEQKNDIRCPKCSAVFKNTQGLSSHKSRCMGGLSAKSTKTNEKSSRTCIHCKSLFKSISSAVKHQENCKRKSGAKKSSSKPVNSGKSVQVKKSFLCGKCKRYFGNAGALAFHKYSCKGKVEASKTVFQGSAGSVVCSKCKRRFGNLGALGAHKKFCIVPKKGLKKMTSSVDGGKSDAEFKCEYCTKTFTSMQALAGHIGFCKYNNGAAKPKVMPYRCQKCKQGFLTTQSLAVHVKHQMCGKKSPEKKCPAKPANKENKCSKCNRKFGSPGALGFHFKTCQGKKPEKPVKFKCKYCSTVSKDAKTYAAHVKVCKVKKGSSLFVTCEFCKGRFPNMQSLGGHIRFCTSREKFPNNNNNKDAKDVVYKFTCKLCGMKTKTLGGLTYHMVYFCKKRKGGKVIKGMKSVVSKKTVIEQSPGKEVSCRYCGKLFGNTSGLGSHVRHCKMRDDAEPSGKATLVKNASKEFKNNVHVVYVFICPQCGVKFDNKAQLLEHFVECLNADKDDDQDGEPQPGPSGAILEKKDSVPSNAPPIQTAEGGATAKSSSSTVIKDKTDKVSVKSPILNRPVVNEPCNDCDWGALSAKDNDIQCHKKYCLNSKQSATTTPKVTEANRNQAKCEICGMEFKSKECLNVHFKFCKWVKGHKVIANLPKQSDSPKQTEVTESESAAADDPQPVIKAKQVMVPYICEADANDSVIYKCEYCGRTSNNKAAVINHVRYCVHRPQHLMSPSEPRSPSGTTVIDLSHLSSPKS